MNLIHKLLPYIPGSLKVVLRKQFPFLLGILSKQSQNIQDETKLIFIHNPKCAGTTIKKILNINPKGADHRTPSDLVPRKKWENYISITVVRHPLDRFVSSYFYHISKNYQGYFVKKYPNLKNLSMEEYFDLISKDELGVIRPNVDFTTYKHSSKKKQADHILRFENLEHDLAELCQHLDIEFVRFHENKTSHKDYRSYFDDNPGLKKKCLDFYKEDFETFGYKY